MNYSCKEKNSGKTNKKIEKKNEFFILFITRNNHFDSLAFKKKNHSSLLK